MWEVSASPSTITSPRAQADDIGATFAVPSSFSVDNSATGVPKYRMLGAMVTWSTPVLALVPVSLGVMVSMSRNRKEVLFR